jgi:hypothetical protein
MRINFLVQILFLFYAQDLIKKIPKCRLHTMLPILYDKCFLMLDNSGPPLASDMGQIIPSIGY